MSTAQVRPYCLNEAGASKLWRPRENLKNARPLGHFLATSQAIRTRVLAAQSICLLQCYLCDEIYEVGGGELQELINELAAA